MIKYDKEKITNFNYIRDLLEGKYIYNECLKTFVYIKYMSFYTNSTDYALKYNGIAIDFKSDYTQSITVGYICTPPLELFLQNSSFITKENFTTKYDKVMEEIMKKLEK